MSRDAFIGFIPVQKGQDVSKSSSLVSTSDGLKIDLKRVGCLRAAENFVRRSFYEKVGETAHEQEWAKFQQLLKLIHLYTVFPHKNQSLYPTPICCMNLLAFASSLTLHSTIAFAIATAIAIAIPIAIAIGIAFGAVSVIAIAIANVIT